jgi:diguanylate cyclase (GGDEF)-like protein
MELTRSLPDALHSPLIGASGLAAASLWQAAHAEKSMGSIGWNGTDTYKAPTPPPRGSIAFTGSAESGRAEIRPRQDPLTGLANRPLLMHHLTRTIHLRQAPDNSGVVMLIDIDHFDLLNDCLGRAAGDSLLALFAARLQRHLPVNTMPARLKADVFAVVLGSGMTAESAALMAVGLLGELARPVPLSLLVDQADAAEALPLFATACIGISAFPRDGASATKQMQCANVALQRAKAAGSGSVRLYAPKLDIA